VDIQHYIDRLEQLLQDSRKVPFSSNVIVDEDRLMNIIDQMRVSIPDVVKRAGRVEAERERILAQAKEEGERIRELARQEAMELVDRDTIIQNAHKRADNILVNAQHEAERLRHDADDYVMRSLAQLEQDMTRSLGVIRNGIHRLQAELQASNPDGAMGDSAEIESDAASFD
jgi:cell division septum initiation protein DivIVA